MSVSKLESLPNEILVNLLEKYVSGVDVFVAFAIELNKRFGALVLQCRQFDLNFESIRKYNFRLCIGLLPDYRDRIEGLTLSERDTPGQIHAFLSFFPTFDKFKQLRRLCLNFDGNTMEKKLLNTAIESLRMTNIHTLSIEGINTDGIFPLDDVILAVLTTKTLRRLFLSVDIGTDRWSFQRLTIFNVEHLTIEGHGCTWSNLETIFKCATRLSYLKMRLIGNSCHDHQSTSIAKYHAQPIIKLHTLILTFINSDPLYAFEMLVPYLRMMSNLRQLEISDRCGRFLDGSIWQKLLTTSLPLLSHFVLRSGLPHALHRLTSFQTPFWIENKTYNVYIITYNYICSNNDIVFRYWSTSSSFYPNDHLENEQRSHSYWTIPRRCENDSYLIVNNITTLYLEGESHIPSKQYYLNNVKHLTVNNLTSSLFRWITTYIDLLHLTELLIPTLEMENDAINSLLARVKNITSLQIQFNQLFNERSTPLIESYSSVKRLDLSVARHPFQEENISVLARLFPSIEHLIINTIDLNNVPLLNLYLSKLHSLTFNLDHVQSEVSAYLFRQSINCTLQSRTQFLFKSRDTWITVWIDEAVFQEPFWQYFSKTHYHLDHGIIAQSHKNVCNCCRIPTCILI